LDKQKKDYLVNDIENQLDDFFGEAPSESATAKSLSSLEKLKSVVLSIDWEITETGLTDLINETDVLLPQYENDRFLHTLLRMLRAVGRYIRQHKAQAHPDAIKRVMSVFASIERLSLDSKMPQDQKKVFVAKEIAAFKNLKQQVEIRRVPKTVPPPNKTSDLHEYVQRQKFEQAMNEVEQRLNSQVTYLKQQLENLQKELNKIQSHY
jgi:hypothetical protein